MTYEPKSRNVEVLGRLSGVQEDILRQNFIHAQFAELERLKAVERVLEGRGPRLAGYASVLIGAAFLCGSALLGFA